MAVTASIDAFQMLPDTPVPIRARLFFKLQELIRINLVRLGESITAGPGKIRTDTEGDVFRGLEVVEHACGIMSLQMGGFVQALRKRFWLRYRSEIYKTALSPPFGPCQNHFRKTYRKMNGVFTGAIPE